MFFNHFSARICFEDYVDIVGQNFTLRRFNLFELTDRVFKNDQTCQNLTEFLNFSFQNQSNHC